MIDLTQAKRWLDQVANIIERASQNGHFVGIERDIALSKMAQVYDMLLNVSVTPCDAASPTIVERSAPVAPPAPVVSLELESEPISAPIAPDASHVSLHSDAANDVLLAAADDLLGEIELDMADEVVPAVSHSVEVPPVPVPTPASSLKVEEPSHAEIVSDRFRDDTKSLNEQVGSGLGQNTLASQLLNKPIADISKAIGLGDKHVFIKELFGGNAELYAATINKLNRFDDLNAAIIYLQENFNWSSDNQAAVQLIELVRRKYL